MQALLSTAKHYRSITGCYGTFANVAEALRRVAEHYGMLWNVKKALRIVMEHYGSITEEPLRNVTEP